MFKPKIVDENYRPSNKSYVSVDFGNEDFKEVLQMTDGQELFNRLSVGFSVGDKITLEIIELTDEEYAECCAAGDELA